MDTEHNLQPFPAQPNGKPLKSLPQVHSTEVNQSDGQTVDLGWVLAVARRRAWLMTGVALTLIVGSGLWLLWSKRQYIPEYRGSFKLLVEPVTAENLVRNQFLQAQSQGANIRTSNFENTSLLDYESQIRVLKSPQLISPIVDQLQNRYPDIDYNSMMGSMSIVRMTYEKNAEDVGTKILEVIYQDKDIKKIKFVLKTISDKYLDYSLQERQKTLTQGITFIESQLPRLQQQVDQLQEQLQKLRQDYNLIDPQTADQQLTEHVLFIRRNRLETAAQLAETRSFYNALQQQLNEADPTAILSTDAQAYGPLLSELQKVEAQLASESAQFRADSPPMEILRERQENLRLLLSQESQDVLENLAGKIQGLEDRYQTILQTENQINQQLEQLPNVTRQITDLDSKLDLATDNLKEFLSKRETLKLDAAQQQIPWELINPPEIWDNENGVPVPVDPQPLKRPLAIAVILSVFLSIGVGFLVEILHTVFHTPEDIKGATKLPILGVIPLTKQFKKLSKQPSQLAVITQVAHSKPEQKRHWFSHNRPTDYGTSPFMEAFRSLYTNIRLLSAKKSIQSLAISSAVPGDGKTTVAVYLAQTSATIGKRVLLVDTDLRSPQLHSRLDLPNTQGLSDIIATDLMLQDAIQKSSLDENLFVLTAGQSLSDPVKLLSSDKMQYLMDQVTAQFDLVIYDTPPLLGLGDGNLLAAKADGTILVVGVEKTDRSLVMKAFDGLKIAGASVLGIVANGVKSEATPSYGVYRRQAIRY
ncbi:GumC family protein [Coleofasciculus sp. F4-SAH-05]|uniref:GumC family protein n=1 Tax=Coleofasciculus sp. F4-SAH-05 TaxID=3069525 RepID=UPI003303366D